MFPSYDGNGMFLSTGNIANNGRIGLLFIDFNTPHRIRAHTNATLVTEGPLLDSYPGADLVVERHDLRDVRELPPLHHQAGIRPSPRATSPIRRAGPARGVEEDRPPPRRASRPLPEPAESEGGTISIEQYNDKVLKGET